MVVEQLEARHAAQHKVVGLVLQVQTAVQQVTFVAAPVVVGDAADVVGMVFLAFGHAGIFVGISALMGVFVVQGEVQFQVFVGQQDGAQASAELVVLVHPFVIECCVLEEPALMLVEEVGREGKLLADAMVVADAGLVVVVGGGAQREVGALISEGRFGEDTYQSAHRVASVQGTLRAAHHVDAFDVGVVEVEGRLVDEGNVVHVQSDGGRVDTRTDAAHVDRSSQFRTVVGDEQVGHKGRQVLDRLHGVVAHVGLRQRCGREGLLAQSAVLFRCGDDYYFFDIDHFGGVLWNFFSADCLRCSDGQQRQYVQDDFLHELMYCLFRPQSKGKSAERAILTYEEIGVGQMASAST